jgi:hypothetical protein
MAEQVLGSGGAADVSIAPRFARSSTRRRALARHGAAFAVLVALVVALPTAYVSASDTFYYWDQAAYADNTIHEALQLRELDFSIHDIGAQLAALRQSTARDYSEYHAVLLAPFVLAFGDGRLVFILALSLVYLLPFVLVLGAIARKLVPAHPARAFWATAFTAVCLPATWLPVLNGYPDVGAAALTGLAVLAYLHDPRLRRWWQILAIGAALAFAIVFRRHFVYDGLAFFATASLVTLGHAVRRRSHPRAAIGELARTGGRLALAAVATLAFLFVLGGPFLEQVTGTNFGQIYSSFESSTRINVSFYRSFYGWGTLLLALAGFLAATRTAGLDRRVALFCSVFGTVSVLQWVFVVRQLGVHYSTHFTSWVVLGLVALGFALGERLAGRVRLLALAAVAAVLLFGSAVAFLPLDVFGKAAVTTYAPSTVGPFFPARFPPPRRDDAAEVERLVQYLRAEAGPHGAVYVAASSHILSDDLVWHVDRSLNEDVLSYSSAGFWRNRGLNVLHWVPFFDSNGRYPLPELLRARLVVVAEPFQHNLPRAEQDVIAVAAQAFADKWPFSRDFRLLPATFGLADGVEVSVYKRVRQTSLATTLDTLRRMQSAVGERPGAQPAWIPLGLPADTFVDDKTDGTWTLAWHVPPEGGSRRFLLEKRPGGTEVRLTGTLYAGAEECLPASARVSILDPTGHVVESLVLPAGEFDRRLSTSSASLLSVTLRRGRSDQPQDDCWGVLDRVTVSAR